MYQKCELYYYEGLYLNDEEVKKLNIKKTDGIGLVSLLQSTNRIFEMNTNGYINGDKKNLQMSAMKMDKEFCYIMRNDILVVLPFKILYGIRNDKEIVAIWDNEKVRDVKFDDVKRNGVGSIISEMSKSLYEISEYEKQLRIRNIYNNLHI